MMKRILLACLLPIVLMLAACGSTGVLDEPETKEEQHELETPVETEQPTTGSEVPKTPEVDPLEESLELMSYAYLTGDSVQFKIVVTNMKDEDVTMLVPSGLKYDIVVTSKNGEEVYRYSEGKVSTMAILNEVMEAKQELEWTEQWDLTSNGSRIEEGVYDVSVAFWASNVGNEELEELSVTYVMEIPSENTAFRNIEIEETEDAYVVTGEARVFEAVFQYTVEDGHNYVVDETVYYLDEGAPSWSKFEIIISKKDKPKNGVFVLALYERSAKDGEPTNVMTVILD